MFGWAAAVVPVAEQKDELTLVRCLEMWAVDEHGEFWANDEMGKRITTLTAAGSYESDPRSRHLTNSPTVGRATVIFVSIANNRTTIVVVEETHANGPAQQQSVVCDSVLTTSAILHDGHHMNRSGHGNAKGNTVTEILILSVERVQRKQML